MNQPSALPRLGPAAFPLLLLFVLGATIASAQSLNVYAVGGRGAAPNLTKAITMAALGAEAVSSRGFGVGGEIGIVAGKSSFATFSLNGSFHLLASRPPSKFDPFVSGGYTRATAALTFLGRGKANLLGSGHLGNVGGGANVWFAKHFGIRAEFRDFLNTKGHVWGFRIGPAFR